MVRGLFVAIVLGSVPYVHLFDLQYADHFGYRQFVLLCVVVASGMDGLLQPGYTFVAGHDYPPFRLAWLLQNSLAVIISSGTSSGFVPQRPSIPPKALAHLGPGWRRSGW